MADSNITTAKVADDAITAAKMPRGFLARRQGGTTGAASWMSTGTSNTDLSATDLLVQVGSTVSVTGSDFNCTFPVAYSQIPIVFCSLGSASGFNGSARVISVTATAATFRFLATDWTTKGGGETINWLAVGLP